MLAAVRPGLMMVCVLLVAQTARATRALPVTMDQLVQGAELVIDGDIGPGQSFRVDGRIFTRVEVRVRSIWKGIKEPQTVSVIIRGGVLDGIGQRVDGEAVLTAGDRAVLFLRYDPALMGYRPVAMEQGAFNVGGNDRERARLSAAEVPQLERRVRELRRDR